MIQLVIYIVCMTHASIIQVCILVVVITSTTDVIVDHTIVHAAAICGEENVIYFRSHEILIVKKIGRPLLIELTLRRKWYL